MNSNVFVDFFCSPLTDRGSMNERLHYFHTVTIFGSELSFRRKQKTKTVDHKIQHQNKETDYKFKLEEMSHAEKMAAHKSAAEKQHNDHTESMAKLKLEEQKLQTKNSAINHSAVKSQTLIPGQFIQF